MAELARTSRWELSPEIRAAAKQRLPLRLPKPDETGAQRVKSETRSPQPVRRIERPATIRLSDAQLESLAQQALLQSGITGFTKLHVEVRDQIATLYGTLPTEFERQLAVQMIRRVNGLVRVDHKISLQERTTEESPAFFNALISYPSSRSYLIAAIAIVALLIAVVRLIPWS